MDGERRRIDTRLATERNERSATLARREESWRREWARLLDIAVEAVPRGSAGRPRWQSLERRAIRRGHEATFPVSLTVPIVGVKPYIVNGEGRRSATAVRGRRRGRVSVRSVAG